MVSAPGFAEFTGILPDSTEPAGLVIVDEYQRKAEHSNRGCFESCTGTRSPFG